MTKFLLLISLLAKTSQLTNKDLDDLNWNDMIILFGNTEWVELFEKVYRAF